MFYLKFLWTNFKRNPLRSTTLIASSLLLFILTLIPDLTGIMKVNEKQWPVGRYFFVIIEGAQVDQNLQDQLSKLPGVASVIQESEEKVKKDLGKIVGKLDLRLPDVIFQNTPQVFKIMLSLEMNDRGEKLLQDYIKKIIGPDFVTFSMTKDPSQQVAQFQNMIKRLNQIGRIPLLLGSFILWLLSLAFFGQVYLPRVFVVENYQRRKKVALKSLTLFFACLLPLGTLCAFWLGGELRIEYIGQLLFVAMIGPSLFLFSQRWTRSSV